MHVVHVIDSLRVGGLEYGVVNVINGLREGFKHTVVCIGQTGPLQALLGPDVEAITLNKNDKVPMRFAAVKLVGLFRRLRSDIVHSRNWGAVDAIPAAAIAGVPVRIHNEEGWDIADLEGRRRRRNAVRRFLVPLVDRFVVVSRDLRSWLEQTVGVPDGKVVLLPNGVDTVRFSPMPIDEARAALGFAASMRVVGTVGRLDPVKDQATLLRAFADVAATRQDARLVIIGDGGCRRELQALGHSLGLGGCVRFLGMRDDVPRLLKGLDIFALPSLKEGMSFTILEAMATGLPIVATRVGGNPELIDHGLSGTLVPPGSVTDMAAALARYLDEPKVAVAHGQAARRRAVEQFALESMLVGYRHLYRTLSESRHDRRHRLVGAP